MIAMDMSLDVVGMIGDVVVVVGIDVDGENNLLVVVDGEDMYGWLWKW